MNNIINLLTNILNIIGDLCLAFISYQIFFKSVEEYGKCINYKKFNKIKKKFKLNFEKLNIFEYLDYDLLRRLEEVLNFFNDKHIQFDPYLTTYVGCSKNDESENGHRWLCFRFYYENNVFLFNLYNDIGKTNTVMFIITSTDFKYQSKKAESVNGFESAYCILDKKFYDIINQVNEKK